MRGFLLLSQGRSGSSWLCSLTNATGQMGNAGEKLSSGFSRRLRNSNSFVANIRESLATTGLVSPSLDAAEKHMRIVLDQASTENGRFGLKIFPHQLLRSYRRYGYDFIVDCLEKHATKVVLLERKYRIDQAISYARAEMTGSWRADKAKRGEERYDFASICTNVFRAEENDGFWRSYLVSTGIEYEHFYYEDLLPDPSPYLESLARHLDVQLPPRIATDKTIQRDELTRNWRASFTRDLEGKHVLDHIGAVRVPRRTIGNFVRFLRKQSLD